MSILMSLFGNPMKSCPDCGSEMKGGQCDECGYGAEEDDMEEEGMDKQQLLDIKDELQRIVEKINRLIVNSD